MRRVRERGVEDIENVLDGRGGGRDRHVGPLETGLRRGYRGSQGPWEQSGSGGL